MSRSRPFVVGIVAVLAFITLTLLSASFLNERLIYASDSLVYLRGAESLASGDGYAIDGAPQTAWPPGYSFFLSLFYRIGMGSITAVKAVNVGLATLALWVGFLLLNALGSHSPLLIVSLVGVCFPWIYNTHFVGSDILFTVLVLAFLHGGTQTMLGNGRMGLCLAGACLAIAPLVRMAGVALFAPWFLVLAPVCILRGMNRRSASNRWSSAHASVAAPARSSRRIWRFVLDVGLFLLPLVPLVLWSWRNMLIVGSWTSVQTDVTPEYLASMHEMGIERITVWSKLFVNMRGYVHILAVANQSSAARLMNLPWVVRLACVVISGIVLVGWGVSWKRRSAWISASCFAAYAGMLMVHNWYDIRYLLPVLPLYFTYLASGMACLLEWFGRRVPSMIGAYVRRYKRNGVLVVMWGLFLLNLAVTLASPAAARLRSPHYTGPIRDLHDACLFLRQRNASGVLVASTGFTEQWIGGRVVPVSGLLDASGRLKSKAMPDGINYILTQRQAFVDYDELYITPIVRENHNVLTVVYTNANVTVFMRGE